MSKNIGLRAALTAFAAVFALTTTTVDAEAKPPPKTTKASVSDKRPDASRQRGQTSRGGTTAGSATRDARRPDTSRNRVGYLGSGQVTNPSARQWRNLVNETAQRRGLPQQRPGVFTRLARGFKGLFSRSQ